MSRSRERGWRTCLAGARSWLGVRRERRERRGGADRVGGGSVRRREGGEQWEQDGEVGGCAQSAVE